MIINSFWLSCLILIMLVKFFFLLSSINNFLLVLMIFEFISLNILIVLVIYLLNISMFVGLIYLTILACEASHWVVFIDSVCSFF